MNTKLILGCIGGTSALGGAAGGCYYLLNNKEPDKSNQEQKETKNTKSLKEVLAGVDFVPLNTTERSDDTHWKKLITKHKDSGVTKKISIVGVMNEGTTDEHLENIKKLQAACATLLAKTNDISEEDKEMAKSWCNQKSKLITG